MTSGALVLRYGQIYKSLLELKYNLTSPTTLQGVEAGII